MTNRPPRLIMLTFALLFIILFFYGIIVARGFLSPLILGIIFSYLIFPFTNFLEKKAHFPRIFANLVGIFSLLGFFTLVFFIMYKNFGIITEDMPDLVAKAHSNIDHLGKLIASTFGITVASQNSMIHESLNKLTDISGGFGKSLFKGTTSTLFTIGLIPVFMFYMLFYREKFHQFILMVVPKEREEDARSIIQKISHVTPRYIGGVFTVVLILSILNSFGLWVVGVKYAILFGIISAMFNLIPYFGTWIGASIPFTFALLTGDSPHLAFGVLLLYVIIQFIENNILTPNITGSYVNLNPFITIVLIILGGAVWGIIGMFIIVPVMAMFKIVFDHSNSLKPIAFLIGADAENRRKALWRKKFLIKSRKRMKKS